MTVDDLLTIEEIKELRLGYSEHFDAANLDALAELFTDDATCDFGEYGTWVGKDTIRKNYAETLRAVGAPFDSMHYVMNPRIRLTGPTTANGRWYLMDFLTRQKPVTEMETRGGHDNPLLWLAIYEDDYVKVGGKWKISYCKLHFLWPKRLTDGKLRHP
jgi:hypothetical protein